MPVVFASNQSLTIILKAGTQGNVYHCAGSEFLCIAATGVFTMSFDGSAFFQMQGGLGFSQAYTSLWFSNTSAADISVTFYFGTLKLNMSILNFVPGTSAIPVNATITSTIIGATETVPGQLLVTANAGVATPLSAASFFVTWFEIVAQNTYAGGVNAGTVRLGASGAANSQPRALSPGDAWDVSAKAGGKIDLNKIYMVTANNGDGVTVLYFQ